MDQTNPTPSRPPLPREEIERLCLRNLLSSPEERMFFKDLESRFLLVSEGFLTGVTHGLELDDVIGKSDFDLFSVTHASEAFADEQHIIRTGESVVGKIERETFNDRSDRWVSTTKRPLRDHDGNIIGTYGFSLDVTAEVEAQQALAYQALHDPVTGLSNRVALMDHLRRSLAALRRQPARLAVLMIDLDDFKHVNDALGHAAADDVLAQVGRRLRHATRRGDTLARFGGDEFVVCATLAPDDDVRRLCERITKTLRSPIPGEQPVGALSGDQPTLPDDELELADDEPTLPDDVPSLPGHAPTFAVTGSVGAVVTDDPAADPNELLQQADLAMDAAKRAGRNHFEIYSPTVHGVVASGRRLAGELRSALARGELFLMYQPLFQLSTGSMTGVEALVRWRHPERGLQSPAEFIPIAEQYGLIEQIDSFVLNEACRQLAAWTAADPAWAAMTVAVNLSGHHLCDASLVDRVVAVLSNHGIEPGRLCLEITETAMIGELGEAHRVVDSLSAAGVRIALDDFGTGYSTLAHLQRLRADILKIDRSFVAQLGREHRDREIIAAVTAMAHALGMIVVGEGVETALQRNQLALVACDEAQGYLFSPPLSVEAIGELARSDPDASSRATGAAGARAPRAA